MIDYSTHPRKNLIYLLNLTICTRDSLYIIPSLIAILLLCVVSLLPGKSNPGQQVLVQGNQIQHVATMLQGNVDSWLIPFLRIQTTVMVSLRYFSCQAIVAVLIIYNNNGNIFCYGMLFLREFGNVFRRRENEAKIKFIYFEITFKRMLFHIWIFHLVLELFRLMWYANTITCDVRENQVYIWDYSTKSLETLHVTTLSLHENSDAKLIDYFQFYFDYILTS